MNFEKYIDKKVKSKNVLEIGGIGDYKRYHLNNYIDWRHYRIKKIARNVTIGDISKDGINHLNKNGFDVIYFDVEKTNIVSEIGVFDTILLLDVIEHLSDIGVSLGNISKYMDYESELIITTPNITSLNNIYRALLGKKLTTLSEHTVWIDEINFQELARRNGFEVVEIIYFTFTPNINIKQKVMHILGSFNKYIHQNIGAVLKKKVNI